MANVGGANVLANLKQRMQTLRDELDRCKDSYDDKCRELEAERELRNEVSGSAYRLLLLYALKCNIVVYFLDARLEIRPR